MKQAFIYSFKVLSIIGFNIVCLYSCHSKTKQTEQKLQWSNKVPLEFLTYGLPGPHVRQNAEMVITRKWGFRYKRVAGCMVTQLLVDSVKQRNDKVNKAMEAKYGKNWFERFKRDVDKELVTQNRVIALLNKEKRIINKRKELEKDNNGLDYFLTRSQDTLTYDASVEGYELVNGNVSYVSFYRYKVSLSKANVKLVSDSIQPL